MADQEEDQGITAYHGSPHEFEQFDLSKIGTGEGAQAYGHGLYFAENEPVAKVYRDQLKQDFAFVDGQKIPHPSEENPHTNLVYTLANHLYQMGWDTDQAIDFANKHAESLKADLESENQYKRGKAEHAQKWAKDIAPFKGKKVEWKQDPGHMYEVSINAHPDHFLDWDKPLNQQHPYVDAALQSILKSRDRMPEEWIKSSPGAEKNLLEAGIKGIKYLDAGSRGKSENPTRNYVVFDDKLVNVKRRYARGGAIDGNELQKAAHAGRNGDTILAHINPQEAALLKRMGGSGTINPHTGLPEFSGADPSGSSVTSSNYGGGSTSSGGIGSDAVAGGTAGNGGGSGNDGGGGGLPNIGGGGNGGGNGGGGMGIGLPSGAGAFGRPAGGVSSGLGFDPNSGAAAGEMAPITGGYKNMALGSNIGGEMLGQTLKGGSVENFSPVGSGISNFNINGVAPQAGFGDKPSMFAGNDVGPNMTIGGSLGAAQVEAMRSGSDWSNQYDPTGISKGIALGQQLATPTNAAREANVPQATGMFGQTPMGTTTFGTGIRPSGFPTSTGVQDPSQAAYAEQMAKTAREAWLAQNYPESPRLGDLTQPTPAAPFATPNRAGSSGSMPIGTTPYTSDLTPLSSQPARPVTPTPFSGFPQDVQNALNPTRPDSAYGSTLIDPTGKHTQQALEQMNIANDAITMLNSPTLMGSLVRMVAPTPTPATPEQQAAINRMYQGSLEGGVPANFATLEGMAELYGPIGATPLPHPGQTADAYLSAGPSASIGRQDMPIVQPSAVGSGTPLDAYEPKQQLQSSGNTTSVRDNFNAAFAAARANGQETFEWTNPFTGRTMLYTTQLARKQGGRVPSMSNPDDWLASVKETRKIAKISSTRKPSKIDGTAIVNRAVMLSSRKS